MGRAINGAFIILFVAVAWFVTRGFGGEQLLGFQFEGTEVSWLFFSGVTFFTLAGTVLGVLSGALQKARRQTSWEVVGETLRSPRFGASLLVSPLVVFYVFRSVYDQEHDAAVLFSCLQSGFFWERTLKALSRE